MKKKSLKIKKIFKNLITFNLIFLTSYLLIFALSCASSNISSEKDSDSIRLADGVTLDMLNAEFWIKKAKNPYKIKMTRSEIARWNHENTKINLGSNDFYLIFDLRKYDNVMSASEIRSGITKFSNKRWYKKVLTKNGEEEYLLTSKDWRAIYDEMNYSRLETFRFFSGAKASDSDEYKKDLKIRKAVCVRRSDMRLIPDDTFYTDDKDDWYDDIAQNSGIQINEPVLVLLESKSGKWLYVKSSYCTGWVKSSDFAFCSDEQFERYFDFVEKDQNSFITITDDRFSLSSDYIASPSGDFYDSLDLSMGTHLFTIPYDAEKLKSDFPERAAYASYMVELPYRKSNGNLGFTYALIPASKCILGLFDFTQANLLTLAFKSLGNRYGWGGMAGARDCSEYLKDIFRCFGLTLPRNSRSQISVAGKTIDFEGKSLSKKESLISHLEPGTLMGFSGHVFMYLGKVNGKNYVISALGSYYDENADTESDKKILQTKANSVNINTLEVKRKSGKTWLEVLSKAKILENDGTFEDSRIFFNPNWQFADFSKINSGNSFLYKSTEKKRKNITIAVNAGHGTKGGAKEKTYSHPDKTPKVTGGTNAKGVIESTAISDGMIFNDGKTEAEVNLRTARILKNLLLKKGYDVLMIRDSYDTQLDNIARTVIANNNSAVHIAIHYDSDGLKEDKGVFYCSIPEGIKNIENVSKHWKESEKLGECLIEGLKNQELKVYKNGKIETDLTQTCFSTIASVDIELGNQCSQTSTFDLEKRAKGIVEGLELFFKKE